MDIIDRVKKAREVDKEAESGVDVEAEARAVARATCKMQEITADHSKWSDDNYKGSWTQSWVSWLKLFVRDGSERA